MFWGAKNVTNVYFWDQVYASNTGYVCGILKISETNCIEEMAQYSIENCLFPPQLSSCWFDWKSVCWCSSFIMGLICQSMAYVCLYCSNFKIKKLKLNDKVKSLV